MLGMQWDAITDFLGQPATASLLSRLTNESQLTILSLGMLFGGVHVFVIVLLIMFRPRFIECCNTSCSTEWSGLMLSIGG